MRKILQRIKLAWCVLCGDAVVYGVIIHGSIESKHTKSLSVFDTSIIGVPNQTKAAITIT